MFGCSTVCPNCKHEFQCCPPPPDRSPCCPTTRTSGGGLIAQPPPEPPPWSPSTPLTFIMPPLLRAPPLLPAPIPARADARPETRLERLAEAVRSLRQSGWFYEGLSYQQSNELLRHTPVGTFLVRYSSDPKFYFSMGVQSERGPMSVRLYYVDGYFRLDAQPHLKAAMPMFADVISLVEHYVAQSRLAGSGAHVWVDPQGKWYSSILLDKPLRRRSEPPTLKHLARVAVHAALRASARPRLAMLPPLHAQLDLPKSLVAYLSEYPFAI